MKNIFIKVILLIGILSIPFNQVSSQGVYWPDFGKSRVQHKDFDWYFYRTSNFDIYYYVGGRGLARFVATQAKEHLKDIENYLDFRATKRLTFVLYNSYTDLRQSNIGYTHETDNPGGITTIVGTKAFIYFDGDHFELIRNIRSAISQILINEMFYGGNIQERVQNSALLPLPQWYLKGLIDYIAQHWSVEDQRRLRNGIMSGRLRKFNRLSNEEKVLIGKSLWKYIADVYGKPAVSNIIYLTRINKSLESGYVFVLGKSFNELYEEWYSYYLNQFNKRRSERSLSEKDTLIVSRKLFRKGKVTQVKLSYDGRYLAYVTNQMGLKKVWIYDRKENRKKKVFKKGYKSNALELDYTYPVIAWQPVRNFLTIVYEDKSRPEIMHYDVEKNKVDEKRKVHKVEKILDLSFSDNSRRILLSAVKKGQSDIYLFNWLSNSLRPLTRDVYDDLHPSFVQDGNAVVFSSNRVSDTLMLRGRTKYPDYNNNFDVFYLDLKGNRRFLRRVTRTPLIDELHPNAYDSTYFSYLTNDNGVWNRDAAYLDRIFKHTRVIVGYTDTAKFNDDTFYFKQPDTSALDISPPLLQDTGIRFVDTALVYKDTSYIFPLTNYTKGISDYQIFERRNTLMEVIEEKGAYKVVLMPLPRDIPEKSIYREPRPFLDEIMEIRKDRFLGRFISKKVPPREREIKIEKTEKKKDTGEIDISNYYFQSEFPKKESGDEDAGERDEKKSGRKGRWLDLGPSRIYFMSFTPDYVISQLDNSILNTPYLPFNKNNPQPILETGLTNALIKMGISDLFQDYRLIGGFRILGNFNGADYFLSLEDLKHRLDKRYMFFRKGETIENDNGPVTRETTHEGRVELRWPFSEISSIRGQAFLRRDEKTILSTDKNSLEAEGSLTNWIGTKFEYVLDNSRKLGVNLRAGTRLNLYTETYQDFDFDPETENNTLFHVFGGDIRNYLPVLNQIVWANRLAFASSLGKAKVVYYLGGVDNWLFPRYNEDIQVNPDLNYVYKTLATNMRGFRQNIRNGNSYSVVNSELRVPLFKLFSNKPIKNNFVENFQVVGFGDIGTAWTGPHPFDEENAFNTRTVRKDPVYITVVNLSNPIVAGYGFGFRTSLLGYYLRLDFAWGMEDYITRDKAITYFSLGKDF